MTRIIFILFYLGITFLVMASCKKQGGNQSLTIKFKKGNNYISADTSIKKNDTLMIGIIADKGNADLNILNMFESCNLGGLVFAGGGNDTLEASESSHLERDFLFYSNNSGGCSFEYTVYDAEDKSAKINLGITVQ